MRIFGPRVHRDLWSWEEKKEDTGNVSYASLDSSASADLRTYLANGFFDIDKASFFHQSLILLADPHLLAQQLAGADLALIPGDTMARSVDRVIGR